MILTSTFKSSWGRWLPTYDARKRTCDRKAHSQHIYKPSGGTPVTSIYRDKTFVSPGFHCRIEPYLIKNDH
jgi:hypothetical protein